MKKSAIMLFTLLLSVHGYAASQNDELSAMIYHFYKRYIHLADAEPFHGDIYEHPDVKEFIYPDTIHRLHKVQSLNNGEMSETMNADYFLYAQDYIEEWGSRLRVGAIVDDPDGGKQADVWLGKEDGGSYQIKIWLTDKTGKWQIYRVRNVTENVEQNIFCIQTPVTWSLTPCDRRAINYAAQ